MNANSKSQKSRMIHIRLNENIHRRLKVYAAEAGMTIQQTVENLIRLRLPSPERKKTKQ